MAKIDTNNLSKEVIAKAMECQTAEELMALAKAGGYELTRDEAEAYMAEMEDVALTDAELKQAAGGDCWVDGCKHISEQNRGPGGDEPFDLLR